MRLSSSRWGGASKAVTLGRKTIATTADAFQELADSFETVLNAAGSGATFDVAVNQQGGFDLRSSSAFSIKAADDSGAYNELHLGNSSAVCIASAASKISLPDMNAAFTFTVAVSGVDLYKVNVKAKASKDADGIGGLLDRINYALNNSAADNGGQDQAPDVKLRPPRLHQLPRPSRLRRESCECGRGSQGQRPPSSSTSPVRRPLSLASRERLVTASTQSLVRPSTPTGVWGAMSP